MEDIGNNQVKWKYTVKSHGLSEEGNASSLDKERKKRTQETIDFVFASADQYLRTGKILKVPLSKKLSTLFKILTK